MKNKIDSVLNAWYFLEAIQPKELKLTYDVWDETDFWNVGKVRKKSRINISDQPWKKYILKDIAQKNVEFEYYMLCYEQWELTEQLRNIFNNDEEIVVKNRTINYGVTFSIDSKGNYIQKSLFIPFVYYFLKVKKEGKHLDHSKLLIKYFEIHKNMERETVQIFMNGVNEFSINKLRDLYLQNFQFISLTRDLYLEIKVHRNSAIDIQKEQMKFNSFFLGDMDKVKEKGVNSTLRDFIIGNNKRMDIDNNREIIEQILQPKNLPLGRWPSSVSHRSSLMQQVAINQIINGEEKILSVNGPPGTGKTTLLKDVFADIVVQRAMEMVTFKCPTMALTKKKEIFTLDGYNYRVYELNKKLKQHSIVVASSNNGAVENISKDLPKLKEIVVPQKNDDGTFKQGIKNNYDQKIAENIAKLDFYPSTANRLIKGEDETWGLFGGVLGNKTNINDYFWGLLKKNDNGVTFIKQLEEDNKSLTLEDWNKAVSKFNSVLKSVKKKKDDLQKYIKLHKELEKIEKEINIIEQRKLERQLTLSHLQVSRLEIEEKINSFKKPCFLLRLFGLQSKQDVILKEELNKKLKQKYKDIKMVLENIKQIDLIMNNLNAQKENILQEKVTFDAKYVDEELELSTNEYWAASNNTRRQQTVIWQTNRLNYERSLLFILAMNVHKIFIILNYKGVGNSIRLLANRDKIFNLNHSQHKEHLKDLWHVIHLVTPLISTTFASFSNMYRGIESDFISNLFIDEAGQASPQFAVGALWRSKKAVIVGDPIQIEPVVTIDKTMIKDICENFKLEERYMSGETSVQTVADLANRYGTYKDKEKNQWIGIPLWVHRRCLNPMFSIANEIAYDNKMVLANSSEVGISEWIDCVGKVKNDQYVEEQGKFIAQVVLDKFNEKNKLPSLFVITPFRAVREGIQKEIRQKLKHLAPIPKLNEWLKESVGTVHTFQGKEADIVYFVTGTDDQTEGAADWTCTKPNLLNVAVTRAKKEFYVVGDFKRFKEKKHYDKIVHFMDMYKMKNSLE